MKVESYYVGIDPSLTGTGVVILDKDGEIYKELLISTYPDNYICSEQRLLDIVNEIKFIKDISLRYAAIEGISFNSKSTSFNERCGLFFMITSLLFDNDIPFKIVPPKTLKKWAVGNGNADKKMMMNGSKKRWGLEFKDDNICDAYNLAQLVRCEFTV